MAISGKRWTVDDRDGNPIYLTEERWAHIVAPDNHPEVEDYEELLRDTLRQGRRRQEPLNPRKYRYTLATSDLPPGFTHLVAIVVFGFQVDAQGHSAPNHYVATAFLKHIVLKN